LVRRRKRDIYGNWVWEDDDEIHTPEEPARVEPKANQTSTDSKGLDDENIPDYDGEEEAISLDWRDFVALSIASLETFLLPIVVFILVLVGIIIGLSFFH